MTPIEAADGEGLTTGASKSIAYRFEKADFRALAMICNRGWAARCNFAAIIAGAFVVTACVSDGGWPSAKDWIVVIAIAGMVFVIGFAIYPRVNTAGVLTRYRHLAVADKPVVIDFGAEGLGASVEGTKSYVPWTNFIGRVETADRMFLKLGRYEAIIIPRRAFADDREFQATLTLLRAKVENTAR